MNLILQALKIVATAIVVFTLADYPSDSEKSPEAGQGEAAARQPPANGVSGPLPELVVVGKPHERKTSEGAAQNPAPPATIVPPVITSPPGAAAVEQTSQGARQAATLVESFDGLGVGFEGPQGTALLRNPSDNTLAVGLDHVFQIVNTRMAIYSKKGK
ncbi:MAG TPA: hypothetical protein VK747_20760 [Blastocatellia bacterium]|nr:hypothetical protein [Blastocatellia bacterium]